MQTEVGDVGERRSPLAANIRALRCRIIRTPDRKAVDHWSALDDHQSNVAGELGAERKNHVVVLKFATWRMRSLKIEVRCMFCGKTNGFSIFESSDAGRDLTFGCGSLGRLAGLARTRKTRAGRRPQMYMFC